MSNQTEWTSNKTEALAAAMEQLGCAHAILCGLSFSEAGTPVVEPVAEQSDWAVTSVKAATHLVASAAALVENLVAEFDATTLAHPPVAAKPRPALFLISKDAGASD